MSPNSVLGHYSIVNKIGAGGMGEVYLAQDQKLDRKVALKVLPADLSSNEQRMTVETSQSLPNTLRNNAK